MEEKIQKNIKAKPNLQYSTNEFLQDLNKLSLNEKNPHKLKNSNIVKEDNQEIRNKINSKLNFLGDIPTNYYNEVMAVELKNLSKENSELKFCLDKLNKKFEKEMKDLKTQNTSKIKEINSSKEIMKKNVILIELLGKKISKYEQIFKDIENKKKEKNILDKNINEKLREIEKENEKLLLQIEKRDNIIKNFKEEIDSKKEIFEEINKMKLEMESNLNTMDNLYKEIQKKDETINNLKKLMELMNNEHKQEINKINKENINNVNTNFNEIKNEDLIKELEKSKEKQIILEEELEEIKKNYNTAKEYNNKMQELTKEASKMIKNSIDSREQMKQKYDEAIKELIEKYEKQIQFMKVIIVEQNEKYEKKINEMKKEENKDINNDNQENKKEENIKSKIEDEKEKDKYLEKLKNDNKVLLEQNSELKHMNEMLLSKMKDLPELNKRFNELFETVKLLKEENDILKKSMKNSKIMKMLELEQEKEEDEEEKEENKNEKEEQKFSEEELQVLESIFKDIENGNDIKGENNTNKLEILENILKKLENKNEDEYNEEDNKNEEEKNNENDEEYSNTKYNKLLESMVNSLENNNKNNEKISNTSENEKVNISNNKIYNKKVLKSSPPGSIKKKANNNEIQNDKIDKLNLVKKNLNKDNEEKQEKEDKEEKQNKINENYNLYKPTYKGMISFNLSKKLYSLITPKEYEEFLKVFDPKTSIQYNTLEGLFVIPSDKTNQLFYYSFLKNTISELFSLKENHSGGCLFFDNTSKNIITIGGDTSKKVEKFSFEDGTLEELPELPDFISKMTCIQIGNKIYSLFGVAKEGKGNDKSPILCLDLENKDKKWEYVQFEKEADFKVLSGMSCTNLNDNELLIFGGIFDDEIPNDKLMYFNLENKKLLKIDKSLPESENKKYVFTQNSQFNLIINGDNVLYANIDNNNQIHIFDNELHYELYLTPSDI